MAYPNYKTQCHVSIGVHVPHHLATQFLEVSDWHSTIVQLVVSKQMYSVCTFLN